MVFTNHIRRCNFHEKSTYLPWLIDNKKVGYIDSKFTEILADFPHVFKVQTNAISLSSLLASHAERTDAVETVLGQLRKFGIGGTKLQEPYAVFEKLGSPHLMTLDRGAATFFGIISTGFHLNGTVTSNKTLKMWIARRAKNKPTFPGQLDNLVAGGQPANIDMTENLYKECREEASLPKALAMKASLCGYVSYTMQTNEGLRRHLMHIYDLRLPETFVPYPLDGEVEKFMLKTIDEVMEIVITSVDAFKFNCNLVIIDFLIRHGYISPAHHEYYCLVDGLHSSIE